LGIFFPQKKKIDDARFVKNLITTPYAILSLRLAIRHPEDGVGPNAVADVPFAAGGSGLLRTAIRTFESGWE